MAKVTYIQHDNSQIVVDIKNGQSVKDGAVNNMVPGILAECGGCCICATCHVYVDENWAGKIAAAKEMELEMLEEADDVKDNSRLSCQIVVTDDLDGLVVRVPEGD